MKNLKNNKIAIIKSFVGLYNWVVGVFLAYDEFRVKNHKRHNCSYCKKRYWFDVPKDVPVEQIVFICKKCEFKHTFDILGENCNL